MGRLMFMPGCDILGIRRVVASPVNSTCIASPPIAQARQT